MESVRSTFQQLEWKYGELLRQIEAETEAAAAEKRSELQRLGREVDQKSGELGSLRRSFAAELELATRLREQSREAAREERSELERLKREVEEKSGELASLRRSAGEVTAEMESVAREKRRELDRLQREVEEAAGELGSLRRSAGEVAAELESRGRQLQMATRLRERNLEAAREAAEDCARESEAKERKLRRIMKEAELREESLSLRVEELCLFHKKLNDCLEEIEAREKTLSLLSADLDRTVKNHFSQPPQPETCAPRQGGGGGNKDSLWALNESLKSHGEACSDVTALLRASPDPAGLALRAMRVIRGDPDLDRGTAVRRSSVLMSGLSDLGGKSAPEVGPQAREEAAKLAGDWRDKMAAEGGRRSFLEASVFLQFLLCYGLVSEFDRSLVDVLGPICPGEPRSHASVCALEKDKEAECIEKLIQRGETIHAVRHIVDLKLTDAFSPAQLLGGFLSDAENYTEVLCKGNRSNQETSKAVGKELAALESAMDCIKEFNLEAELPRDKILKRVGVLRTRDAYSLLELAHKNAQAKRNSVPTDQQEQEQEQQQGKRRKMAKQDLAVEAGPITLSLRNKPPKGSVQLNFSFLGSKDCGFGSVVARDHTGAVLNIWYRKIPGHDPLVGSALAAQGALALSASKWSCILLQGDSFEVISCLKGNQVAESRISGIMSDLLAQLKSFAAVVLVCIPPQANVLAHYMCHWASKCNVQDDQSWIPMPSELSAFFGSMKED